MQTIKTTGVLVVAILAGCTSEGSTFSTGVPPSKVASEVMDAEAKTICQATIKQFNQTFAPDAVEKCPGFGPDFGFDFSDLGQGQ